MPAFVAQLPATTVPTTSSAASCKSQPTLIRPNESYADDEYTEKLPGWILRRRIDDRDAPVHVIGRRNHLRLREQQLQLQTGRECRAHAGRCTLRITRDCLRSEHGRSLRGSTCSEHGVL